MYSLDHRQFYIILNSVLHLGLDTDEDRVRECQAWIKMRWATIKRVLTTDEARIMRRYLNHVHANPGSIPSRADLTEFVREMQQNSTTLDLLDDFDRYTDLEQLEDTSLSVYLEQRIADWEKLQFDVVMETAKRISIGSWKDERKKPAKVWQGTKEAIQYVQAEFLKGILIDDRGIDGGDLVDVGVPEVADRIHKDIEGVTKYLRSNSPLDLFRIGPDNAMRYIGIAGYSNHRKSTVLFTLAYLAACQGYRVMFVPRECTVEQAERKFVWLHAHRKGVADRLPSLLESYESAKLLPEHEDLVRWLGEDMKSCGIHIEIRACNDWAAVKSSVDAHVDAPYDVLCVDYIAHLDTPGERDQREGIRNVYRMAQDLSLSYEGGRGLCVLTPMQISKTEEDKVAAGEGLPCDWGNYEGGRIGVVEYHTDAPRGMDGLITMWSGTEFQEDGLIKVCCIKTRGQWFKPFYMRVEPRTQFVKFCSDREATDLLTKHNGLPATKQEQPKEVSAEMTAMEEYL